MKKWLCICQFGHSRSVALTRVLHHERIQAVAVGAQTAPNAIEVLAAWADVIAVLQPHFLTSVPVEHRGKVIVIDVGPDRWSNPYHPELLALLKAKVESYLQAERGQA